jgi:TPR repeat protein
MLAVIVVVGPVVVVGAASAAILYLFLFAASIRESRLKPLPLPSTILLPLLTFTLATTTQADYQSALNAYNQGNYPSAMQQWLQVTESPDNAENPYVYAEAHYAIAKLYWLGQGTPRDYYRAYDWLLKAAELNHAGAMGKLGYLYTDGIAVQQDFSQAFEWYSKAAKLGDVDALYNIGIFYLNGWGTEQDTTMAKQYLAAASAQGDQAAEQALQSLLAENVGAASAAKNTELDEEVEAAKENVEAASAAKDTELDEEVGANEENVGAALAANNSEQKDSRLKPLLQPETTPEQELIQDEPWILAQPPEHYTIQAIGLSNRGKLESLVTGYETLKPFAIYTVQKATNPIHILIQGNYATVEEARAARDNFPSKINRPNQVWIRQFKKIQELIETESELEVGAASAAKDTELDVVVGAASAAKEEQNEESLQK